MNKDFQELFSEELADIYDAEQQILKALPKMIKEAKSGELQQALENHRQQTEGHVQRLEQLFEMLDEKPKKKSCKGMDGLLSEGEHVMKEDLEPEVMDAAIIGAAQKVEHYEMATYGTLRTFAAYLGNQEAIDLLDQTLQEEREADETLTQIAESSVNMEAAAGDGEMEEKGKSSGRHWSSSRKAPSRSTSQRSSSRSKQ